MKFQRQRTVNNQYGDCFPACLASILELPIEVIPNDHSHTWMAVQRTFLGQFGLEITSHDSSGPIWAESPWIAGVKSKNYEGGSHAIVMQGSRVLFDPSTMSRYKKGEILIGTKIVTMGYIIRLADASKLHNLDEYRARLTHDKGPSHD